VRTCAAALALACVAAVARAAPQPDECERLFAIRHSMNRNEVVYEACFRGGAPESGRPVLAHWHLADGTREELNALEDRFAYGVIARLSSGRVRFALRGAPALELTVRGTGEAARAVLELHGEACALLDVYVAVESGAILPAVRYVELSGVSLASGALVSERYEP